MMAPPSPKTMMIGVKRSAPEKSPDLAHAEYTLAVRAGFGQ